MKKTISKFSWIPKIILTFYLIFSVFIVWQFDTTKLFYPLELFIALGFQISFSAYGGIYIYFMWFKKEIEDKLTRNILIVLTVFIILAFPISYGILLLGKTLSQYEGVKIGTADGWLAFIGSIFGGIITMIAVVFTINNEKEIRKEEKILNIENQISNIMPLINIDFLLDSKGNIERSMNTHFIILKLINESASHAIIKNLKFSNYEFISKNNNRTIFTFDDNNFDPDKEYITCVSLFENTLIAGYTSKDFLVSCLLPDEVQEYLSINQKDTILVQIPIIIEYSDILKLQEYEQLFIRGVLISLDFSDSNYYLTHKVDFLKTFYPPDKKRMV